jgi:hypothetical protein
MGCTVNDAGRTPSFFWTAGAGEADADALMVALTLLQQRARHCCCLSPFAPSYTGREKANSKVALPHFFIGGEGKPDAEAR